MEIQKQYNQSPSRRESKISEANLVQHTPMFTGWLTCTLRVLRPHSPCRSATVNTPANRRMRIASVVSSHNTNTKQHYDKYTYTNPTPIQCLALNFIEIMKAMSGLSVNSRFSSMNLFWRRNLFRAPIFPLFFTLKIAP